MNKYRVYLTSLSGTPTIGVSEVEATEYTEAQKKALAAYGSYSVTKRIIKVEGWITDDSLPTRGYWDVVVQYVESDVDGRVETGPLKVNGDHCGYFTRGDNAMHLALSAEMIREWLDSLPEQYRRGQPVFELNEVLNTVKQMGACAYK
jgi:hypothetical protein